MPYKTFQIDGIGDVIITKHARSKNIRIRIIGSRVKVSIPRWVPYKYALKYTEQKKPWIKENIKQKSCFYSGAKIGKHHELQLIKNTKEKLRSQITEKKVYVYIPEKYNLSDEVVQRKIQSACEKALTKECSALLPNKLHLLSLMNQLDYKSLAYKRLTSRWGSCDAYKNITINTHLIQLPDRLIDYVLIHELAHTKIMNHGSAFWQLVERCMPDYKEFRSELKTYAPEVLIS